MAEMLRPNLWFYTHVDSQYDRSRRRSGGSPMAQYQAKPALDTVDPVWARIRREAEDVVRREPELATFIYSTILHHDTLEAAIVYRLAERLDHPALSGGLIRQAYADALRDSPSIGESVSRRSDGDRRSRSGDPSADRAGALLQGLPRHPDAPAGALAVGQGPPRFRALSAKPLFGGVPVRHPSGRARSAAAFSSITPPASWSAKPR